MSNNKNEPKKYPDPPEDKRSKEERLEELREIVKESTERNNTRANKKED